MTLHGMDLYMHVSFRLRVASMGKLSRAWVALKKTNTRKENGYLWVADMDKDTAVATPHLEKNLSLVSVLVKEFGVPGKAVPIEWLKKEACVMCMSMLCVRLSHGSCHA